MQDVAWTWGLRGFLVKKKETHIGIETFSGLCVHGKIFSGCVFFLSPMAPTIRYGQVKRLQSVLIIAFLDLIVY